MFYTYSVITTDKENESLTIEQAQSETQPDDIIQIRVVMM